MGRHEVGRRTVCVVRDPRRAAGTTWWAWLVPLAGLVLWPIAPVAGLLVAAGLLAGVGCVVRYRLGPGVRLEGEWAAQWRGAADLLGEIRQGWSSLGAMAEPADIGPTLALTGYHLAKLARERARLAGYLDELDAAAAGLADAALLAEVDERRAALGERRRELDAQFAARVGALRRLSQSVRGHERVERVRALLAAGLPGPSNSPDAAGGGADPIAEVAGRTELVLAAYRELSGTAPVPSETRSFGGSPPN
ncbi:hypothetical protein [Dactylosporangium salmoneum]|uniref:Secreted protein n=1 Tax=Dactylosporangium salmoneum TaxID=53361 RepID=A0ABP5TML4_9ACTN